MPPEANSTIPEPAARSPFHAVEATLFIPAIVNLLDCGPLGPLCNDVVR
jgi:hypothetical protein